MNTIVLSKKVWRNIWIVAFMLSCLSACGGSDSSKGAAATEPLTTAPLPPEQPITPEPSPEPESSLQPGIGLGPSATSQTKGTGFVSEALDEQTLDQDQDGLIDSIDAYPNNPLLESTGINALTLSTIGVDIEGFTHENMVISGLAIKGNIANVDYFTGPFYLLWYSDNGVYAQEITVNENGDFFDIMEENLATGVSVATQEFFSKPVIIKTYPARAPLIYLPSSNVFTGEMLDFNGRNLPSIDELWLGDTKLSFSLHNQMISTRLPAIANSSLLTWVSEGKRYSAQLPLKRIITLAADVSLGHADEWWALTKQGILVLSPDAISTYSLVKIALPISDKPTSIRFYHDEYRSVDAVVWPDARHVVFGIHSTIENGIVSRLTSALQTDKIAALKIIIKTWVNSYLSQNAMATLAELHRQEISIQNEALLQGAIESILSSLATENASLAQILFRSNKGTDGVLDYFRDTFDAIFASNTMYEPIMSVVDQRAVPGRNAYSGMNVSAYRNAAVCVGLESVNRPSGLWPSDLCVKNSGVYFASLKVTNPVTKKVLKKHISQYLDKDMIGASGWGILSLSQIGYVTSDAGSPLCHMQACELEFLTGGFGLGTSVTLTKEQDQVQRIVLGRTLLERVVLPILAEAMGSLALEDDGPNCLISHIVLNAPLSVVSYGTMIAEFKVKIDAAGSESEVIGTALETVVKYAYDVAASMVAAGEVPKCLPAAMQTSLFSNLSNRVGAFADKVSVPLRYANIANDAMKGFEAIITPEKFTFEVAPRAAITNMTTSNSSADVPELMSTLDSNKLLIRGTKFVYLKSDNTNYWPKLRLTDRSGNAQTLQLNESHKVNIADISWVDIAVPVSDLAPLMQKLRGELIHINIIMDDVAYPDFPNNELPVIGRDIRWVGQPKITITQPNLTRAGSILTLKGENLQSFANRADLKLILIQATDPSKTGEIVQVASADSSSISFRLPANLPNALYKLRLETSDPNTRLNVPDDVARGPDTGAVLIIPQSASTIELFDSGAKPDDTIVLSITDDKGNLILQDNVSLTIEISANKSLRSVYMWWTDTNLSSSNNGSNIVGGLDVACELGGTDQVCTYRARGEVNVGQQFRSFDFRGKLLDGESTSKTF